MAVDLKNTSEANRLFLKHLARRIFLEDWAMKALALAITIGLWYGVTGLSTPVEQEFSPQFDVSIPNDTEITNVMPTDIEIRIGGDKRKIDQITRGDLTATLDLSGMKPSNQVVTLTPDNVRITPTLPTGLRVTDIVKPTRIAINLEAVEDKDVDVNIVTTGAPASGYEVYSMTAVPGRIRVRGPETALRSFDHVDTQKIDLTSRTADFTATQVPVSAANPAIAALNTVADVIVRIGEKRSERGFTVTAPGPTERTVSFDLYGPVSVVSKVRREALHVTIQKDENGVDQPVVTLPPELEGAVEIRDLKLHS